MNERQRIAVNTASRYAAQLVDMVVGFFLTPFLIHSVGATLLGLHFLARQALRYCRLAGNAIGSGYARFATEHHARRDYGRMNDMLGAGLLLSLCSSLVILLGTALLAVYADVVLGVPAEVLSAGRWVIVIAGLAMAAGSTLRVWEVPVFVTERFYLSAVGKSAARLGAALAVVVAFYVYEPSIIVWVVLSAWSGILLRVVYVIPRARRALPQMRVRITRAVRAHVRPLLGFSVLALVGGIGNMLYYATDAIIISNLDELGPGKIVPYNIAQRWDPMIRQLIGAFAHTTVPMMTGMIATERLGALRSVIMTGTRYCLLLGLFPCITLAVLAEPFILHWIGPDFLRDSAAILQWLMFSSAVSIPAIMGWRALFAMARLREAAVATLFYGIVNVVLSVLLVKWAGLGLLGIALGTVITLGLKNALYMPWLVSRRAGIPLGEYVWRGYSRAGCCAVVLGAAALGVRRTWEAHGLLEVFAQFFACALVYGVAVWVVGLTTADRQRLRGAALRVWRRARSGGGAS